MNETPEHLNEAPAPGNADSTLHTPSSVASQLTASGNLASPSTEQTPANIASLRTSNVTSPLPSPDTTNPSPDTTNSASDSANESPLNLALDYLEDSYGFTPPEEAIYDRFTTWAQSTGRTLYPHQEDSLLAALAGDNVIVATPTGSGKSMVALAAIFTALAHGKTAYYTAPLKALVSEKFFELIQAFGAHNVGMITGDSSINAQAPIICATAEIVANMALREGDDAPIDCLIADEFHFYGDPQRGWAWQVPLLELHHTQHVLLSATLGDTSRICADLERRTGRTVTLIDNADRPVPLLFEYSREPIADVITELVHTHRCPAYVVHFAQRDAVSQAQALLPINLVSREEKAKIADAIGSFRFGPGFGKDLSKLLRAGIGVHHAGILPRYRRLVERLAQAGLLKVICGTDTLGVGINVPIRTVVLTSLSKFDGSRSRHLSAREFHQIAGRAGRAGFDTIGHVIVQAPEYEIENAKALEKAGDDPKKLKKLVRKKAPEGVVLWSEKTLAYLQSAPPEPLTSRMKVNHAMILNILQRPGDAVTAAIRLLTDNHEPSSPSNVLLRQAVEIYETLRTAGVLIHHDLAWQKEHPGESAVTFAHEVPDDFALNSPLSPFALAALELLDPASADYALDVVSVIEAVQENPMQVLYAQERQARGEAIGKMKASGMGYEERMAEADKITWPQPLREELHAALAVYRQTNPWVDGYQLTPKSIVRAMVENSQTFSEFISRYDLARSEGVVLRYLSDTYKALRQTVPMEARTQEFDAIVTWLGNLVRAVDSSLLDEWEALADGRITPQEAQTLSEPDGGQKEFAFGADEGGHFKPSRNRHFLRTAIRNSAFRRVEAVQFEDLDLLDRLDASPSWREGQGYTAGPVWDGDAWMDATDAFFDHYGAIGTGSRARSSSFFHLNETPDAVDLAASGLPFEVAESLLSTHKPGRIWILKQLFEADNSSYDNFGGGDEYAQGGSHSLADVSSEETLENTGWGFTAFVDLDECDEAGEVVLHIVHVGEVQ